LVAGADANLIWPYLSLAWRMLGDERWFWLEGDPSFIRTFDIAAALPPLDELRDMLRELHHVSAQPLDQSLRGGTQTDGNLFQQIDPRIRQLRAAIAEAVDAYVAGLPPRDENHPLLRHRRDRPVRFSGAWSVRLTDAGFHASHNHPAGWISSALYVALPPAAAGAAEDAGWIRFGVPQAELGLDLDPIRTVKPEPGTLVLFPSTMWHGTVPFPSGERITVAFDVAPPRP
ncbi:MAG: putative 2OG-Fe(II) oxygenase, partial [Sphingomonadales bacterium]